MIKEAFLKLIGTDRYIKYVAYLSDLYHSMYRPLNEDGIETITRVIPSGGVVLDIGANIGLFTAVAARAVGPHGKVLSFEPGTEARRILGTMVRLKRFEQVHIIAEALSDTNRQQQMAIPLKAGWKPMLGLAHLESEDEQNGEFAKRSQAQDKRYEPVTTTRLDDFCTAQALDSIDFIKCDTEGSEFKIFTGGQETLNRFKPPIFCEIEANHCQRYGVDPQEIFTLLQGLGYNAFIPGVDQSAPTPVEGYVRRGNYFFFHADSLGVLKDKNTLPLSGTAS